MKILNIFLLPLTIIMEIGVYVVCWLLPDRTPMLKRTIEE